MDKTRVTVTVRGTIVEERSRWWKDETLTSTWRTFVFDFQGNPYSTERPPKKGDFINIFVDPSNKVKEKKMQVAAVNHPGGETVEFEVIASFTFTDLRGENARRKLKYERLSLVEQLTEFGYELDDGDDNA